MTKPKEKTREELTAATWLSVDRRRPGNGTQEV